LVRVHKYFYRSFSISSFSTHPEPKPVLIGSSGALSIAVNNKYHCTFDLRIISGEVDFYHIAGCGKDGITAGLASEAKQFT